MVAIRHNFIGTGALAVVVALTFTAGTAAGQDRAEDAQKEAAASFTCSSCGVEVLDVPNAFDDDNNPVCGDCHAKMYPAEPESEPYNILTTKQLTGDWGGLRTDLKNSGVNFSFLLGTMSQINFRGGVNTHNAHETGGRAFYNLELDFEKMVGLKGATFFARGIQTWNSGIRADVGSLQHPFFGLGSSGDKSIEIDKYHYRQRLFDDRLEFRLGMLSGGDYWDRNVYADNYVNRFMHQVFYKNPAIPGTKGLGLFVRVWPTDWLYLQGLVVDPDRDGDRNRHGTSGWETAFHGEDRFRAYWEFGLLPHKMTWIEGYDRLLPGHYRFGWWLDPKRKAVFIDDLGGLRATQERSGDVGFYFNMDQMVWKENESEAKDKQGLGVFARYGWAHRDVNRIQHFWSLGAAYQGIIPSRDDDVLAFGVAQSILSHQYRHNVNSLADRETVYELYYAIKVTPWCFITPDIQIITNPGGNKDARDALVGGLRFKIVF